MDQRPRNGGALMARPSHSGVTVYNFDPKVQARTGKRKPYVIRWRVGGKQSYKSFQYVAEARQFHARLLTAASNGEQFDPATKLPTSWGPQMRSLLLKLPTSGFVRTTPSGHHAHAVQIRSQWLT